MRLLPQSPPLLVLTTALVAALAGCGPEKNEFAPPCPRPSLVRGLEDLTRFRPDGGKDLTDTIVQGRVTGLGGECKFVARGKAPVEVSVVIAAEFQRGPSMQGRQIDVSLFIAVTEGGVVLDKRIMQFPVEFPANVDRVALTSQPVRMVLPTTTAKSPAAFAIVAGFQLTPAEVEANRQRGPAR
jgi:hypothetical protein